MMDRVTKQMFVVQYSQCNIEKWKEWPKKALVEAIMSELSIKRIGERAFVRVSVLGRGGILF